MTVYINHVEVPVSWEQENTLQDIMTALSSWMDVQGYHISSILANGQAAQGLNPKTPKDQIQTLEIESLTNQEYKTESVKVIYNFFLLLKQNVDAQAKEGIQQLQKEYPWIKSSLQNLNFFQDKYLDLPWNDLSNLKKSIQFILDFFDSVFFTSKINLLQDLRTWSSFIHQGDDKKAMDIIVKLSFYLDKIYQSKDLDNISLWKELKEFVHQLEQALSIQDFVLVADLLEYEIVPRLEQTNP